jgi:O-antigen ligase
MMGGFIFPFIFTTNRLSKKMLFTFLVICSFVTIILTVGRSALFGFSLSILFAWFIVFPINFNIKNVSATMIFGLLAIAAIIKALNTLGSRIETESIEATLQGRFDLNMYAYEMARDNLFGVGLGNYPAWYVVKYGTVGEEVSIAHNIYFLTLGELGFLGLFTILCIHIRTWQMFLSSILRQYRHKVLLTLLVASITAWLVLWFQDMFHFTSLINPLAFLLMLMLAIISRIYISPELMKQVELPE